MPARTRTPRLPRERGLAAVKRRLERSRVLVKRTHTQIAERPLFYALIAAGLIVFLVAIWPFCKDHLEAIAVVEQVAGKPVPPLIGHAVAHKVVTRDLTLDVESGRVRARIYSPADKPDAPALVVLHGVHHLGIDYPYLEAFALSMASCGIRVLTPELPDIKDYHVDSTSVKVIGESVQWYAKETGSPVGVMGLSFSGGLALVAAADPLYKPDFKFVFAVGSQDSMSRVAQYYDTDRDVRPNGTTELLPAHEYGPLVLEYEYLEDFVPRYDVAPIRAVLRANLYEDKPAEQAASLKLNDRQKAEALELMDATSARTRDLIAKANAKHADEMAGMSPRGKLARMTTPVYLLHGEADNIIPSAETLWMASELPSESLQAMLVTPVISHVNFGDSQPSPWEEWKLIHFFALVMHATETPSGRTPWL